MTEEQINIAIAEACGWTHCRIASNVHSRIIPVGTRPLGVPGMEEYLPDYLNDLNAMHEAVQQFRYTDTGSTLWHKNNFFLSEIVSRDLGMSKDCVSFLWELQNATATQRREAFLRTIGKWKEAP